MKHEWRKHEKEIYGVKLEPQEILVPKFKFYTIKGFGNPNHPAFSEFIGALYSLSYAIKMAPKKGLVPEGYYDYSVYPLEGVWDLIDTSKYHPDKPIDKDNLKFTLMIRQPDFVTEMFAHEILESVKIKKPHRLLEEVKFEIMEEGHCVQILHLGSYDDEPATFKKMEEFCGTRKLNRKSKIHREIYLSDARKVAPEKLKTILRFQVESL